MGRRQVVTCRHMNAWLLQSDTVAAARHAKVVTRAVIAKNSCLPAELRDAPAARDWGQIEQTVPGSVRDAAP